MQKIRWVQTWRAARNCVILSLWICNRKFIRLRSNKTGCWLVHKHFRALRFGKSFSWFLRKYRSSLAYCCINTKTCETWFISQYLIEYIKDPMEEYIRAKWLNFGCFHKCLHTDLTGQWNQRRNSHEAQSWWVSNT